MTAQELQCLLPPFNGNTDIIVREQDDKDIIRQVLKAHTLCASQYDAIAPKFAMLPEPVIYDELFNFCMNNLPYTAESGEYQSTRTPAGILATVKAMGVDCKHYSGFIGGVLDAVGRLTGRPFDWNYRFAGYETENESDMDHVYIVAVTDYGDELWLDPAPVKNIGLGYTYYVKRKFNDRFVIPTCHKDKFVKSMLVHLSGPTMGDVTSDASTQALNAVEPGLGDAVQQGLSVLPDGDIKDFLQSFLKDPGGAIITLIKGRKYTEGDYRLGEYYMRNILGMSQLQRWENVPNGYVPQAWLFFSTAMGVRVRTSDDMDALCGYANTPAERAQKYLVRDIRDTPDISLEAATRAAYLMGEPSYGGLFSIYQHRDSKWPLSVFSALPYIYPIPGAVPNEQFTGMHPILGKQFVNGYPVDYTGIRYRSQTDHTPQDVTTAAPTDGGGLPLPGGPSPVSPEIPQPDKAALPVLPILLLAGGVLFAANQPKKGGKRVRGARTKNNTWLWVALAVGGYWVYTQVSPTEKRNKLLAWSNMLTDPIRRNIWAAGIQAMGDSEVNDLYDYLFNYELPQQPVPGELLVANNTIWHKYAIPDFSDVMSINLGTILTPSLPSTSPAQLNYNPEAAL